MGHRLGSQAAYRRNVSTIRGRVRVVGDRITGDDTERPIGFVRFERIGWARRSNRNKEGDRMAEMNRIVSSLMLGLFCIGSSGCAWFGDKEPLYTSGTIAENVVSTTAEVIAIDHSTRSVALRMSDGSEVAFEAGPQVRNLDQVEAGDSVRVSYLESVVYHLRKPGEASPGVSVEEGILRSRPGEAPAGAVARTMFVTATVRALDPSVPSATLEASNGEQRTLRVRDADRLKGVKVGDLVEFAFTQAVAVELEKIER
jgi:Cu/Ag efflux protein CusF